MAVGCSISKRPCSVSMIYLYSSILLLLVSVNAFVPFTQFALKTQRASRHGEALQSFTLQASVSGAQEEYSVQVSYEGRSCNIKVRPYETLLAAMERSGAADQLSLPSLPSDCRRGNCLTCSGRHIEGSEKASLARGDDGLSPHMSRQVQKAGYLLTCSSFVVGNGLKIQLGEHDDVWNAMYKTRLEDETAEHIGRVAKARVIRRAAESNVRKWTSQTERVLDQTE